jgi:hypothetical protein
MSDAPTADDTLFADITLALFDDLRRLAKFVDTPDSLRVTQTIITALTWDDSVDDREREKALQRLASYTLNDIHYLRQKRDLTPDELEIERIAERLYDVIEGRIAMPPEVRQQYVAWRQRRDAAARRRRVQ